uniref:Uncharacterized protein n=1 Tax=Anguilla anguilla TaxID=7936 RepID=A0A0E9TFS0_ANGAN
MVTSPGVSVYQTPALYCMYCMFILSRICNCYTEQHIHNYRTNVYTTV